MMNEIREVVFILIIPLLITAVAGYLMYRFRRHLFEMVCSIGFLAGLFCLVARFSGRMGPAVVMAVSIIALTVVRVFHKP